MGSPLQIGWYRKVSFSGAVTRRLRGIWTWEESSRQWDSTCKGPEAARAWPVHEQQVGSTQEEGGGRGGRERQGWTMQGLMRLSWYPKSSPSSGWAVARGLGTVAPGCCMGQLVYAPRTPCSEADTAIPWIRVGTSNVH